MVCDVNSEKEMLQVIFSVFKKMKRILHDLVEELAIKKKKKTEKKL